MTAITPESFLRAVEMLATVNPMRNACGEQHGESP